MDAPIKRVIDILQSLKMKNQLNGTSNNGTSDGSEEFSSNYKDLDTDIDYIINSLTSNSLFTSDIDKINDQTGRGIDSDTKDWIASSLLQKRVKTMKQLDGSDAIEIPAAGIGRSSVTSISSSSSSSPTTSTLSSGKMTRSRSSSLSDTENTNLNLTSTLRPRSISGSTSALTRRLGPISPSSSTSSFILNRTAFQIPTPVLKMLELTSTTEFDVFEFDKVTGGKPLSFLACHLMEKFGLIKHFGMDEKTVRLYFEDIEMAYHDIPYHNR